MNEFDRVINRLNQGDLYPFLDKVFRTYHDPMGLINFLLSSGRLNGFIDYIMGEGTETDTTNEKSAEDSEAEQLATLRRSISILTRA